MHYSMIAASSKFRIEQGFSIFTLSGQCRGGVDDRHRAFRVVQDVGLMIGRDVGRIEVERYRQAFPEQSFGVLGWDLFV